MAVVDIVTHLDRCPDKTMADMRTALANARLDADWVKRHQPDPIPTEGYGRDVLYESSDFELVLATWPVNGGTLPHNHGRHSSIGMVLVLCGEIFNCVYREEADGRLVLVDEKIYRAGEFLPVPKGLIHSMGNHCQDTFSMSLHVYSPSIAEVSYWDPFALTPCEEVALVGDKSGANGGREV